MASRWRVRRRRSTTRACSRWLNRDSAQESGGLNLYCMANNDQIEKFDMLGLWGTDEHHTLIDTWLKNNPASNGQDWAHYKWRSCIEIDVPALLKKGSDNVDGVGEGAFGFCDAQTSAKSYQHSMRAWYQSVATAKSKRDSFINEKELSAAEDAIHAETDLPGHVAASGYLISQAVIEIGEAAHPVEDDTSPPHSGFQVWFGPEDGLAILGAPGYAAFVLIHHERESKAVYDSLGVTPANTVAAQMHPVLLRILQL